jgi:hypothetical protein
MFFCLYLVEIHFVIFRISAYFPLMRRSLLPLLLLVHLLSSLPAVAGVPAVAGALLLLLASSLMIACRCFVVSVRCLLLGTLYIHILLDKDFHLRRAIRVEMEDSAI